MALILETGEGLVNADSLVDVAFLRSFVGSRGLTLEGDDTSLEQKLRLAHDYLLANEGRFQGLRSIEGQALPFPRRGIYAFNAEVAASVVPLQVKYAICQLVVEGVDALASSDGRVVQSETVGPISTTYANTGTSPAPILPRVEAFLAPFYNTSARLSAIRV